MKRIWGILSIVVVATVLGYTFAPGQTPSAPATPAPAPGRTTPVVPQDVPPRPEAPARAAPATATEPPATPGRHENAAVTLDWVGPPTVQAGQANEFTLVVKNTCPIAVHKVVVNVRAAPGMTVTGGKSDATNDGDILRWQLGSLLPSQEKSLPMQIVVRNKGDVSPQASVSYEGSSSVTLRIRAHEPKLTLKTVAPPTKIMVGDTATFVLTVHNAGDGPANQVKVSALLSEGLEHARGRRVDFELGNLSAGESRTVQLVATAKAGGVQRCETLALAQGDVKAQEQSTVNVLTPLLDVQLSGPAVRYRDRKANYAVRVVNKGEVPAGNVTLRQVLPTGFKFISASDGGLYNSATQSVSWFLGEMAPQQKRDVEVELIATHAGDQKHRVMASTERGLNKVEVERELVTRVEELSALLLETADADDPIEVGKDTTYEVLVTNAGSKVETDIKVICTVPDKMELKAVQAPCRYHIEGRVIIFEPLPKLAPKSDACYQFRVRAVTAGDVRFKAQVTSSTSTDPMIKTEATRIYADQPAQGTVPPAKR